MITIAKRILIWTDPMRVWCVRPAISNRLKKKYVYQPDAMAVTGVRIFTVENLAAGAIVVM